jgi:sec-independent protein translocase protein TatB
VFDIGFGEILVLGILALFVFGPDRLPEVAQKAGKMVRQLRGMATQATEQMREAVGPEFDSLPIEDLKSLRDEFRGLDPRTTLKRSILGDGDAEAEKDAKPSGPRMTKSSPAAPAATSNGEISRNGAAPWDADAT